jgi:hypothetical protein
MSSLSRRDFVRNTAFAAVAASFVGALKADTKSEPVGAPLPAPGQAGQPAVRWLDGPAPSAFAGATWGMPWPRGKHPADTKFRLSTREGAELAVQSWPLATWPDGSLKWTAHAVPADAILSEGYTVAAGTPAAPSRALVAKDSGAEIEIDTGVIVARIVRKGSVLVSSVSREGREILRKGRLVLLRQDTPEGESRTQPFTGEIERVTLEQDGPVRAVVKLEGRHADAASGRAWLPFVVRLYFYAGGEAIRVVHTIVYDGDEQHDFIRGLGLRFEVPLRGELHDRHVRFSGEADGLFGEAVRSATGLRRDPGAVVREAQFNGRQTPPLESWHSSARDLMHFVPAFADWSLFQSTADGFEINKRTKSGFSWLSSARGQRAGGLGYVGTPQGGVAFGLRNFWQSHPSELSILGATGEQAEVTLWFWSPRAAAMDLRGYHDKTGLEHYPEQLAAMNITYEDYEPGYDKPEGTARTSEAFLWALPATPSRARLAELAGLVRTPPVLITTPAYLHSCAVFGGLWAPADRSTPARAAIEDELAWNFAYYEGQREQRRWYGYWNYGDVMHTYDADRHEWRYDVGGFAWDNSELSTDIWLWLFFLRTGRADVFRFTEAMTRHTGEVDVHHIGRFAPLGSRHNVLHWGCSAKQLRISTAANRRYYYYLTGDERVGDLMREQIDAVRALTVIQANRKVAPDRVTQPDPTATEVYTGFGTDWGAAASAWLTEWERTGDPKMRDRLLASMRTIAAQPCGFFTGGARLNIHTGAFALSEDKRPNVSHLSAVFGLVEVCAELIQLFDEKEFRQAWLDYCTLYNATPEEQAKRFGQPLKGISLVQGHSRLTAYAAKQTGNNVLAHRAWDEFRRPDDERRRKKGEKPQVRRVSGPAVLRPIDEAPWVSSNGTAQWGLAAIECLALAVDQLPETSE